MSTRPGPHLIGYWIQTLKDEDFCAPQEVVGSLAPDVRSRLADYLDAGALDFANSQLGFSWCRFFCGASGQEMCSTTLTDGCWSWPKGLSHYVRRHGIILPEEFVAHALANEAPHFPPASTSQPFLIVSSSLDYWRKWCAAHRSPTFLKRLCHARAEADAHARVFERTEIQRRVLEEIDRYGLGDDRCMFVACNERVLSGMKLCARHILRDTDHIADRCYAITPELVA